MKTPLRQLPFLLALVTLCNGVAAQDQALLRNANKLYKEGKYQEALPEYQKALAEGDQDPSGRYNLGNAFFKNEKYEEAAAEYTKIAARQNAAGKAMTQKTFYNYGVALSRQKKLEESIEAYKQSLRLNPTDDDARVNLQKALEELRKKTPPKSKEPENQNQQQNKQNKPQDKPRPPQNKMSKKDVERLLKALQQREQQVQQKMQQNKNRAGGKPEQDW